MADKNTGSQVMSCLSWENSRHFAIFATPTLASSRNDMKNSTLVTSHYPDLGSTSDRSCYRGNMFQPLRGTTQIWIVTRYQYGISMLASQMLFRWGGGSRVDVAKCGVFSLFFGYRTTHIHGVTHLPPRAQVEFGLGTDVTPYSSDLTTSHKSSLLQTCTTPTRKDSH